MKKALLKILLSCAVSQRKRTYILSALPVITFVSRVGTDCPMLVQDRVIIKSKNVKYL